MELVQTAVLIECKNRISAWLFYNLTFKPPIISKNLNLEFHTILSVSLILSHFFNISIKAIHKIFSPFFLFNFYPVITCWAHEKHIPSK